MQAADLTRPGIGELWRWLGEVPDPEIPVLSVVDLGIVRDIREDSSGRREKTLVVTVTPTYSGCPATRFIMQAIEDKLRAKGLREFRLALSLSPPWTTDWISPAGRDKLLRYGIAPPRAAGHPPCPRCGSARTARVSEFGSTPCKALYRCEDCLEPFEYFKCL